MVTSVEWLDVIPVASAESSDEQPERRLLASGHADGTVRVWDVTMQFPSIDTSDDASASMPSLPTLDARCVAFTFPPMFFDGRSTESVPMAKRQKLDPAAVTDAFQSASHASAAALPTNRTVVAMSYNVCHIFLLGISRALTLSPPGCHALSRCGFVRWSHCFPSLRSITSSVCKFIICRD